MVSPNSDSGLDATPAPMVRAVESTLVLAFLAGERGGFHEEALNMNGRERIVTEMAFRFGRADIVIFHDDGSATVVEAKDGSRGYNHVLCGIGQVGLYATQLAMTKGAVTKVRRALMWTSTGDMWLDTLIVVACQEAGVIAVEWPTMAVLVDAITRGRAGWQPPAK